MTPAGDRSINLQPERTQGAGAPENNVILVGTAGLALYVTLPGASVPQLYTEPDSGRVFAISGMALYELFAGGTASVSYGTLGGGPYSIKSNNVGEMVIACGGSGYHFNLATNVLVPLLSFPGAAGLNGVVQFEFIDDFFLALNPNSREFQNSNSQDGTTWQSLNFQSKSGGPDNVIGFSASHGELWLLSSRSVELYIDGGSGTASPFTRLTGVFLETGCAAAQSIVKMDNTLYWLGNDERGAGVVWRANGYSPQRVSTHSIEAFLRAYAKYDTINDCVAYAEQVDGHSNLVMHFPSATVEPAATGGWVPNVRQGATWVFDPSTNLWHERAYWNVQNAQWQAHLARSHCYAFGRHLVGDYQSGNVYEMSEDNYDDAGQAIRRVRVAPHINEELTELVYDELELSIDVGQGNAADPDPVCGLRFSKNGGRTYGAQRVRRLGRGGAYNTRVRWQNCGASRRAGFEFSTMARVPVTLIDAFLRVTEGTS
jgi:hypothetical protein